MDDTNSEEMVSEWKTPNSSEFGSLDSSCVKRLDFEATAAEEIIINGIEALELGANKCGINGNGDGNDSGVDTGVTNPIQLQRALSNNSAGYASSSGGLDAQFASCNSSLLSVCSDSNDGKTTVMSCKGSIDCTSENGSESSSLSGDKHRLRQTPPKKRIGMTETNQPKSPRSSDSSAGKSRVRAASANRMMARSFCAPSLATTERARSRDKQITPNSQTSPTKRPKPGTLPTKEMTPPPSSSQKGSTLRRATSVSRRTPSCTPTTEDGRWPSNQFRSASKVQNRQANDALVIKTKVGTIVLDNKSDRFSTMPRRKKVKSEEDLSDWRTTRSSSTTRDRMSASTTIVRRQSTRESVSKSPFPPRYQKPTLAVSKTLIYHEASIQTALTSQDIDDAFGGNPKEVQIDAVAKVHRESQVDIRDREIEQLEEKIKAMATDNKILRQNLVERSQMLTTMEQQLARERDEKEAMKKELQSNTERVMGMLELVHAAPTSSTTHESDASCDSLLMLESQIQLSGHALEEKQSEINKLRLFCSQLQTEMNRSMQVQQTLLEEKKETSELHDFLQDEKTAIFEALKDAETELEDYQNKLKQKELEVERFQDECRHLVRISEQRRQEYLGMQSKYAALESKSKILVTQQNHAVSGATIALSDLGSRLNDLVEQLVATYNISEQELEDVIYHNEAYANSAESSPDTEMQPISNGSASPQRHHSFIAAVINAIKSAATTAKYKVHHKNMKSNGMSQESADSSEMLDSETEPCLMMENVLEDVSLPDSHTHNLISSATLPSVRSLDDDNDEKQEDSLHNLCEAIANRQKIEEQTTLMMMQQSVHSERDTSDRDALMNSSMCDVGNSVQVLVDHVINVDNLVTKLLKVLRIIQIDSDQCIQQLINEKNTLQIGKDETLEKLRNSEENQLKLKGDLETTTKQLINNCQELAQSQTELKKSRREINKLNEDICNLSTLCTTAKNQSQSTSTDKFANLMKSTEGENEQLTEAEITSVIHSMRKEMANEFESTSSTQTGLNNSNFNGLDLSSHSNGDTKCQNDTICKAIETLNGIQSIVRQCPVLIDLQRDLEEMLPSDCNANVE